MERRICIHGHFYQPNRANAWTERIEREPSAAPFHDWNERITAECYRPNGAARVLDHEGRIERIVNNYERISFNVGPTLLTWLQEADPWTYRAILDADERSARRFGGHGSALAQTYIHAILPLANGRDQRTLVRWGRRDFEHRFGRPPEGMWLPETAVDTASLEALAAEGITFTVLAPWQAAAVRSPGGDWQVPEDGVDPTRAYECPLPSGRRIALFFYDGPVSAAVAFEGLLRSGDELARRLLDAFPSGRGRRALLAHVATDGESYGHHHRFGEMALAKALDRIEAEPEVRLTNYGEHLQAFPPNWEVRIAEPTAWSCAHGIERWRSDCGCHLGGGPDWTQAWRTPLRSSLDWLRDELADVFERHGGRLLDDPWATRDDYVEVLLERSPRHQRRFVGEHGGHEQELVPTLQLLEMQRHLLEAFESSAWFYDDAAGLETLLALRHASRALVLCRAATGEDPEPAFVERLAEMRSNEPELDGRIIWRDQVLTSARAAGAVARSVAVQSLFRQPPPVLDGHEVRVDDVLRRHAGHTRYLRGHVELTCIATRHAAEVGFAVLHLGDHDLVGGVTETGGGRVEGGDPSDDVVPALQQGGVAEAVRRLERRYAGELFSLETLPIDARHDFLEAVVERTREELDAENAQVFEERAALLRYLAAHDVIPPRFLAHAAETALAVRLQHHLEQPQLDPERLEAVLEELATLRVELHDPVVDRALHRAVRDHATSLLERQGDPAALAALHHVVEVSRAVRPDDEGALWWAQNAVVRLRDDLPEARAAGRPHPDPGRLAALAAAVRVHVPPGL